MVEKQCLKEHPQVFASDTRVTRYETVTTMFAIMTWIVVGGQSIQIPWWHWVKNVDHLRDGEGAAGVDELE